MAEHGVHHFLGVGEHAAHATVVIDGHTAFGGQAHILYHLSGVELNYHESLDAARIFGKHFGGEGPEGDGAYEAHLDAFLAGVLDGFEADAGY